MFVSLLQQDNWDVAMIVISGTDHIAHLEWQKGNVKEVRKYYAYIDSILWELNQKELFKDATIVVMSDHGFGGGTQAFFMNTWLYHEGYLSYKDEKVETYDVFLKGFRNTVYGERKGVISRLLKGIGLTRENLIYLGKKTGLIKLERFLPHSVISVFPSYEASIDWSKTKAYMMSNASKGININLQGREQTGIVPKSEYDQIRKEIVEKLRKVTTDNGHPIFQIADIKENIYSGPYVSQAPDIVTWPFPEYKIRIGTKMNHYMRKVIEAQHAPEGIYIYSGSDFVSGKRTRETSIMDIAPTLLHIMGMPIPEDMDGKVVTDFFAPNSVVGKRQVTYTKPLSKEVSSSIVENPSDEGVEEKLKALGYM